MKPVDLQNQQEHGTLPLTSWLKLHSFYLMTAFALAAGRRGGLWSSRQ